MSDLECIGTGLVVLFLYYIFVNGIEREKDRDEYERVTGRSLPEEYPDTMVHGEDRDFARWRAAGKPRNWDD